MLSRCHPGSSHLSGDRDLESPEREDEDGNGSRLWAALTTHWASVDRGPCPGPAASERARTCVPGIVLSAGDDANYQLIVGSRKPRAGSVLDPPKQPGQARKERISKANRQSPPDLAKPPGHLQEPVST